MYSDTMQSFGFEAVYFFIFIFGTKNCVLNLWSTLIQYLNDCLIDYFHHMYDSASFFSLLMVGLCWLINHLRILEIMSPNIFQSQFFPYILLKVINYLQISNLFYQLYSIRILYFKTMEQNKFILYYKFKPHY